MGTKLCPQCGKHMIQRSDGVMYLCYPSSEPWHWWCACGWTELGGVWRGKTVEEIAMDEWNEANTMGQEDNPQIHVAGGVSGPVVYSRVPEAQSAQSGGDSGLAVCEWEIERWEI